MLLRDVRYALRTLLRTPGFTAVAVLCLALGIGANSAMFSFSDALLLRPLPVPRASEVVTVSDAAPDIPVGADNISYPDYVDLRNHAQSFDGLIAARYMPVGVAERRDEIPELRLAMAVSGNFFAAMRVQPRLGRGFAAEEDRVPGRDAVAVLGYDAWRQHFSADSKIAGRKIRLNDVDFTIVGVAPESFTGLDPFVHPDLYIPVMMLPRIAPLADANMLERRDSRTFIVKGRLKPGKSIDEAKAEVAIIARRLGEEYPATNRNFKMTVRTELQARVAQAPINAGTVAMLLGIAALVLLIACANVANLLLSRARTRSREMAVRLAIGASRRRLVGQLLTESTILALAGGALGLLLAEYAVSYFSSLRFSDSLPVSLSVRLDGRVLLFSLLAATASVLLFGFVPAIRGAKTDLVPALKAGELNGWRRRIMGRNALVVGQVAMSLMLLCAASVFIRAIREVLLGNPGFRTDHLLMMSFDPGLVHYGPEKTAEFYRELVGKARGMAGVENASLSHTVPFDGATVSAREIVPESFQFQRGKESEQAYFNVAGDGYFGTLGMPLVRGRGFSNTDTATSPRVAVINKTMAERYWPNRDPIGQRFRPAERNNEWIQVVGVAAPAVYGYIGEPRVPFFYLPLAQNPQQSMTLLVQTTAADAGKLTQPLRNMVRSIDAHQPIFNVRTMREFYRHQGLQGLRLITQTVGTMGVLGLSMALIGLYGLVMYSVSRRTREIGIRMAIGAGRGDILRLVLRQGLTLAVAGVVTGLIGSVALVQGIRTLFSSLQQSGIFDAWTFIAVPLALFAVTMVATYIPARRAATVDPNQALHYE